MIKEQELAETNQFENWKKASREYFNSECSLCLSDDDLTLYHIGSAEMSVKPKTSILLCSGCEYYFKDTLDWEKLSNNEGELTTKVIKLIDSSDNIVMPKIHGGPMQKTGLPDFMGVAYGEPLALELKVHPKRPEKIQRHILKSFKRAGGRAYVGYSLNQIKTLFKIYKKKFRSDSDE